MSALGYLTASDLTKVQGSIALSKTAAADYLSLKADVKRRLGRTIAIAGPAGGYRSAAVQHAMHLAGAGSNQAEKIRWGLNPRSTVAIADHPGGTHEDGGAFDVVGTAMDKAFLDIAAEWGFRLQFPGRDPNHLRKYGPRVTGKAKVVVQAVKPTAKVVKYKVKAGDTYTKIAALYSDPRDKKADVTVADLRRRNPKVDERRLKIGQSIVVM